MPGSDTVAIYRGEDVVVPFQVSPVENVTGWTIELNVEGYPAVPKVIKKTPATITDGPNGKFQFALAAVETDVTPGHYQYDVTRTDSGSRRVLAEGTFVVDDVARLPAV